MYRTSCWDGITADKGKRVLIQEVRREKEKWELRQKKKKVIKKQQKKGEKESRVMGKDEEKKIQMLVTAMTIELEHKREEGSKDLNQ